MAFNSQYIYPTGGWCQLPTYEFLIHDFYRLYFRSVKAIASYTWRQNILNVSSAMTLSLQLG